MKDSTINKIIWGVSIFVFIVVLLLNRKVIPVIAETPKWIYTLPLINAYLNGACSILLLVSLYQIKKKNIEAHKKINLTAFILSAVFILLYIPYHYFAPETHYGGEGIMKSIYLFILASHILLAIIVFPLILMSFNRGLQMQVEKHRKLVRFVFPMWLYVTVTGVIVYIMISPYYPQL
jgi:putative membrane protein